VPAFPGVTMKAALLLMLFEPFFQGTCLDASSAGLQEILAALTEDTDAYVLAAEDAFADYVLNADDPSYLTLERVIEILVLLLYADGRSEPGLVRMADLAYGSSRHAAEATNVLAALANYYRSGRRPSLPADQLLERFERYMKNPVLFHNARECRNALTAMED
jgi:hypothetical protein